jgi:hypothetical protein
VNGIDLSKLEEVAEGLALAFYLLMFMALVTLLAGSAGSGFLLLIAGSIAHVGRAGIEEFVAQARTPDLSLCSNGVERLKKGSGQRNAAPRSAYARRSHSARP